MLLQVGRKAKREGSGIFILFSASPSRPRAKLCPSSLTLLTKFAMSNCTRRDAISIYMYIRGYPYTHARPSRLIATIQIKDDAVCYILKPPSAAQRQGME